MKAIDYLSTVSGGGYIGSALTWLKTKYPGESPFGTKRSDHSELGGQVLHWLRGRGKFLTPGDGLNVWALIAAVLTGTLVNLAMLAPIFLLVIWILSQNYFRFVYPLQNWASCLNLELSCFGGFNIVLWFGMISVVIFLGIVLMIALESGLRKTVRGYLQEMDLRVNAGKALMWAVICGLIGTLPLVHGLIAKEITENGVVPVIGIIFQILGIWGKKEGSESRGWRSFLLTLGLSLLIYGLALWGYHAVQCQSGWLINSRSWIMMAVMIGLFLVAAFLTNVNHVSMHRFYRNRLMEAYMPTGLIGKQPVPVPPTLTDADQFYLHDLQQDPNKQQFDT
ncbi:MAG: hypothetical protein V3W14_09245, partial [Candidatus Neomarinimicrobiota bacterium]